MYKVLLRRLINIAMILLIAAQIFACSPASPSPTFQDDSGNILKIDSTVKRIISLAPSNTEIVYALKLEDRLVGVTEYCSYPPEAKNKTIIGGFSTVDIEKTITLQPDLILASDIHSKSVSPMLAKLGFKVATLNPRSIEGVIRDMEQVANICNVTQQTQDTIDSLKERVNTISTVTSGLSGSDKPRTMVIVWHDPLMVAGKDTLIDDIIRLCGATNVANTVSGHSSFSIESLLNADPQVIIIPTSMGKSESPLWNSITTDSRLHSISAVKNNAVYIIDGDILLRFGPRSITAMEQIAALLHPNLFNK